MPSISYSLNSADLPRIVFDDNLVNKMVQCGPADNV